MLPQVDIPHHRGHPERCLPPGSYRVHEGMANLLTSNQLQVCQRMGRDLQDCHALAQYHEHWKR